MAEHPIIFQGEMVRAIYAKLKSQTRRVIPNMAGHWVLGNKPDSYGPGDFAFLDRGDPIGTYPTLRTCPYGVPGDTLWVREGFRVAGEAHRPDDHVWASYIADGCEFEIDYSEVDTGRIKLGKTYPSIHMPRWASRLELKVTRVRVARVQEITEEDAWKEGIDKEAAGKLQYINKWGVGCATAVFSDLWDSINAKRGFGWDVNPYVWVIDFKPLEIANG